MAPSLMCDQRDVHHFTVISPHRMQGMARPPARGKGEAFSAWSEVELKQAINTLKAVLDSNQSARDSRS